MTMRGVTVRDAGRDDHTNTLGGGEAQVFRLLDAVAVVLLVLHGRQSHGAEETPNNIAHHHNVTHSQQ